MNHYANQTRLLVAIDCIIFGFDGQEIKLLLIKRNFEPEQGKWSLMGGFVKEDEDLDVSASRILYELTGLTNIYVEQVQIFGNVRRDPVERTLSVMYFALINIADHDTDAVRSHNASWISLSQKPNLIFDHDEMVAIAMDRLRYKAALHPLGFELLPEKFTIPQLQKLYEAVYNIPLDRRNFSRKLLSTGLLQETGEKDENSATKKAMLYRLNQDRYQSRFNAFWNFVPDSMLV
ncbi:NUDIX domain-containing protein [Spirosoma terrae]|uniref:NUDIX hydrolase n=1 Tax=Spirosoma terrae TaxID=1968276 RepID=A0A6L9LF11_9BACT|nr:NUDIX domain-containing protein [Spirosoma terrae]NDU99084.1 NUDIX hydrolase [Spirosoma terrae]